MAADSPSFAPAGAATGADEVDPTVPALENDEVDQRQVSLIGRCGTVWGDDEAFERQRQAVRRVMAFDGNRTWHGMLSAAISDDLPGWQDVLTAVEVGAYVEIDAIQAGPAQHSEDME